MDARRVEGRHRTVELLPAMAVPVGEQEVEEGHFAKTPLLVCFPLFLLFPFNTSSF